MNSLDFKLFDRWEVDDVEIHDPSLKNYISIEPVFVPHSHGRHSFRQFEKSKINIVERLLNKIMRSGSQKKLKGNMIRSRGGTGKKTKAYKAIRHVLEKINEKTKQNPIQILINAIEAAAPAEETTRVNLGGISYHQAVDVSPQRRIDIALKNIALGAMANTFRKKTSFADCLFNEIMSTHNKDMKSYAIQKKEETERMARSAR